MRRRRAVAAGLLVVLAVPAVGCSAEDVRRSGAAPEAEGRPSDPGSGQGSGHRSGHGSGHGPGHGSGERSGRPSALAPALEGRPVAPRSPREAAAQIGAADRVVQDRSTPPALLAAAAHTQQLAYRTVADHPGWDRRVSALLAGPVRRETRANVEARRQFRSMHPGGRADLATELPAWRIVPPRPAPELRGHYREAERRYGVDWEYLAAINLVETGFGRIDGTSVAGAQGPMQFIPTTWDIYGRGGDIEDPRDAILAAGRLLRANGFGRDRAGALYRYNNSAAYVRGVTLYARVMQRRPRAYLAYHQWPVYYLTRAGSVWLPEGYAERRPVPVRKFLARRP